MATVKQVVGAKTALTFSLTSLASATYVTSSVKENVTNQPLDLLVELTSKASAATSGNKQLILFAQASLDNTNWSTGPGSGTTATHEALLTLIGVLPLADATAQTKQFSVAAAFGGVLPPYLRFVVKNDCGVALSSTAGDHVFSYQEVSTTVA